MPWFTCRVIYAPESLPGRNRKSIFLPLIVHALSPLTLTFSYAERKRHPARPKVPARENKSHAENGSPSPLNGERAGVRGVKIPGVLSSSGRSAYSRQRKGQREPRRRLNIEHATSNAQRLTSKPRPAHHTSFDSSPRPSPRSRRRGSAGGSRPGIRLLATLFGHRPTSSKHIGLLRDSTSEPRVPRSRRGR